jgi:hypothetical protein
MKEYEIHVPTDTSERRVLSCIQVSDYAAIRRAQAVAGTLEGVEVWRAQNCIYAQPKAGGIDGKL